MSDSFNYVGGGFSGKNPSPDLSSPDEVIKNEYFAARKPEETAYELIQRANSFFNLLRSNAFLEKLQRQWQAYYGNYSDYLGFDHRVNFTGEQGELVQIPINHFRNLAQHIFVMITANRPIMEARAINTDYKSLAQTYLANGILEYYMREKKLEDYLKKAVEMCIVLGASFIKLDWNATSGDIYDVDEETGIPIYEGDLEFSNLSPFDVIFDGTKESWNHDWLMVRTYKNRYDLIAKYPEFTDKIKAMPTKHQMNVYRLALWSNDQTDDIPVYEFYHKKTESMPDGRYMLFLDQEVVLLDMKMPYRVIPIFRIAPSDILGTPYGYSPMFDIYPIQEAINSLFSTIMTNQNAFGVQNVFVQKGADITFSNLEGAMNVIEGNSKPEPLNMTQTPAEVFKFLEMMISTGETISGVNSVARGNPEASLKSGTALALVQSMALQFISGLQGSYVKMMEDTGSAIIQILKDYAKTPKIITLVGKNNKTYLKEFTGEQISSINRVIVDVGNPLSRTTAGRVQMAEQLLQMGLLKNPAQYFQVMNTGRLDATFEGEMSQLLNIKEENEKMMQGETTIAILTDQHKMHIQEHSSILDDTELRKDPTIVKNVLAHIQEHIDLLRNSDPDILMLLGQQPLAPPAQAPENMGPGAPMSEGPPPQGAPGPQAGPPRQGPPHPLAGVQHPMAGLPQSMATSTGAKMPNLPTPPAPFKNMPVTAQQMAPAPIK